MEKRKKVRVVNGGNAMVRCFILKIRFNLFDWFMTRCYAEVRSIPGFVRTKQVLSTIILCAVLIPPASVHAAPYGDEGVQTAFTQPDGSLIHLRVYGDEFYAVTETVDGYVLVFDSAAGAYYYAVLSADGEHLLPSGIRVRAGDDPHTLGFRKHIRISREARKAAAKTNFDAYDKLVKRTEAWRQTKERTRAYRLQKDRAVKTVQSVAPEDGPVEATAEGEPPPEFVLPETAGDRVGLTILVDFSDSPASISRREIDDYFNKPGYGSYENKGSVYDYFYKQSARKLRYNNIVSYYVRMPNPKSYYNNTAESCGICGQRLLKDALDVLTAAGFDFSAFSTNSNGHIKACNLLFAGANSGVWRRGLWPHCVVLLPAYDVGGGRKIYDYQMTDIGVSLKIGTVCHENGHMLCSYPDLYDYGDDSKGCGKYSLMAGGNNFYQISPTSVGAYLRYHSGWVDAGLLASNATERCSVRVDEGMLYMYQNPDAAWPGEYFLLENRAKIGFEATSGLPDQGLLIMHCDESGDQDSQQMTQTNHYVCSVEQADNAFHLENNYNYGDDADLFHAGGIGPNTSFSDSTAPNAHWWKNATTNTASGDPSGLNIHSISGFGETMTFVSGAGTPEGIQEIGLDQNFIYMETDYGTDAPSASFAVWNRQGGTLSYSITSDASWLSVSPTNGTASAESDVIRLLFNSASLPAGTYDATVTVTDNGASNSPQLLSVQLVVAARPVIAVHTNYLNVSAYHGSVTSAVMKISNAGGGRMNYSLSNSAAWFSLDCSAGTVSQEQDLIVLTFDDPTLPSGTYYDTITVSSSNAAGSPLTVGVRLDVVPAPTVSVAPSALVLDAETGSTDTGQLLISNSGDKELSFNLTDDLPVGNFIWSDSDDPGGPVYNWIDISGLGTAVALSDDGVSSMLPIGFSFPFYHKVYTQFQIAANGGISFSAGNLDFLNDPLPSIYAPARSLLAFWDDLSPESASSIRYHGTAERLVVSWLGVPRYGKSEYQTFQIVLYPDGRIVFQYKDLDGVLTGPTVGLQDDQSTGPFIQVACNQSWLKDELAVQFIPPGWLTYTAYGGTVEAGAVTSVWVTASSINLDVNVHTARVIIACNDVENPLVYMPVLFNIRTADGDEDGDGISDAWEQLYFGGTTNANPNAMCSNGINTVLEAYIAGLNPNDPDSEFLTSVFRSPTSSVLDWNAATGRVYSVYWTTNLLTGFHCLESNIPWTRCSFTNQSDGPCGYYKLKVQLVP